MVKKKFENPPVFGEVMGNGTVPCFTDSPCRIESRDGKHDRTNRMSVNEPLTDNEQTYTADNSHQLSGRPPPAISY